MSKPKPVNWGLCDDGSVTQMISDLIDKYHGSTDAESITNVNCIAMWRYNAKIDQDNYIFLADISKSTDKVRELYPHDMIIGINKDAWSILSNKQKEALIDAQLERIAVCLDKEGNPKEDDKTRTIYRLRRPEVMDEHTIMRRHGMTVQDIQDYVLNKFTNAGAEDGSYIANALNPTSESTPT